MAFRGGALAHAIRPGVAIAYLVKGDLLIGALVGAGAALLLAPASGDATRKRLRREARRAYLRGSNVLEDAVDTSERAARRMAERGMRRGREVLGKL